MQNVADWISDYRNIVDAKDRKDFIENIPDNLVGEKEIEDIKLWWKVRYFYADKAKSRLGDRFIGVLLFSNNPDNAKMGTRELTKMYTQAFDTEDARQAFSLNPQGLEEEFIDASNVYVETMQEPSPMLGLIPRKDKTAQDKRRRVAKIIVKDHLFPIWQIVDNLPHMSIVAKTICIAANRQLPDITKDIVAAVDKEDLSDFTAWFSSLDIENSL